MDNDNDFLVILDDEDALARAESSLSAAEAGIELPGYRDSSQEPIGIRTRPRVMAWANGHLVMRSPSQASLPHGRQASRARR